MKELSFDLSLIEKYLPTELFFGGNAIPDFFTCNKITIEDDQVRDIQKILFEYEIDDEWLSYLYYIDMIIMTNKNLHEFIDTEKDYQKEALELLQLVEQSNQIYSIAFKFEKSTIKIHSKHLMNYILNCIRQRANRFGDTRLIEYSEKGGLDGILEWIDFRNRIAIGARDFLSSLLFLSVRKSSLLVAHFFLKREFYFHSYHRVEDASKAPKGQDLNSVADAIRVLK